MHDDIKNSTSLESSISDSYNPEFLKPSIREGESVEKEDLNKYSQTFIRNQHIRY